MATVNYQGTDTDFKDVFYPYCDMREGKRNVVYADIKGLATVGIGHLVEPGDNLSIGDSISDAQVQQLFNNDYDTLDIDQYVTELQNAGYDYNAMLAVAHFIWGHGASAYASSNLRAGLLANSYDADSVQTYLAANWDIHSPTNQRVNRQDFEVAFSDTPWTPSFFFKQQTS